MKTVRTIITFLFLLFLTTANAQQGAWSGELDVQGTKLPLVFHFDADACTMDSPTQGAKGIKAQKSYTANGKLQVTVPSIGATFEGFVMKDVISGTFVQNGFSLPLTLKPGAPEVRRPQTPVAPFPYATEQVTFTNSGYTLHGTLTKPASCTKDTPVVLMVTGSGQQNRDEELFDHKPFAVIADALARQGIASLRYDDRGYDDPNVAFLNFTTDDFKCDAEAGVAFLRDKFNKVGVVGHSEGGTIALMLASEGKADFIISLAGMVISGRETLMKQNRQSIEASGLAPDVAAAISDAVGRVFDSVAAGEDIASMVSSALVPDNLKPIVQQAAQQLSTPYMRHLLTINVEPSLARIKCPVLALNGKRDVQVDCTANIAALERGLTNCKHKTVALDNLNHLFQHCITGAVTEYQQIEETISPEVLRIVGEWIREFAE